MEEDKTALNKDERIAARRAKLAARKNKDAAAPGQAADSSTVNARQFPSKAAVAESRAKLNRAKITALKNVEEVSQDHDEAVSKWRRTEAERRDTRHFQIENELAEGARANQAIRDQWEKLSQYTIAQDLHAAIEAQQQACRVLIARKDALVKSLTSEIAERDEAYEVMLRRHAADVSELVQRMQSQVSRLLDCYQKELAAIEDVYVDERRALIESNKEEVRVLFDRRREMELKTMEARLKREEEFQAELDKIRSRDSEDYNNLKITLENNIQLLEQQLEEMRATYQLNIEKLDYNHRVLKEMDSENKQTVKHHKQKLKRLKEALNAHAARYAKQEAAFKQENHELTEEYKRVTEQFKDLQRKCSHFHAVDQHKFKEIWEMNESEVKEAIARLIDADRIIQDQILGMDYAPPPIPQYDRPFTAPAENKAASPRSPLNRKASVVTNKRQSVAGTSLATVLASATSGLNFPSRAQSRASRGGTQGGGGGSLSPAPVSPRRASKRLSFGGVSAPEIPNGSKYSNAQIRHVMELLAEEAGFLVEQKFRERMAELTAQEQMSYSAEAIVHALGVEDVEDLEQLVGMFFQSPSATECHVDPNDVVRVVREFMLRRISNATGGVAAAHGTGADSKAASMPNVSVNVGMGLSEALIANEKKQRRRQHEKEHWQSLGQVIGRPRRDVWRALKLGLEKYHDLLTNRVSLIAETTALSRQNAELKALLQQYMGAKLNQELQIPPTRIVRL